jgi:hypothetical protein
MHLKKTALLAIFSFALLGCEPKTKIDSGTTITATIWSMTGTIFVKDLILSSDKKAEDSLRAMRCELGFAAPYNAKTQLHEANTATLACDKKDMVNFPIELLGPDGQLGLSHLKVGEPITIKLKESIVI